MDLLQWVVGMDKSSPTDMNLMRSLYLTKTYVRVCNIVLFFSFVSRIEP